MNFKIKYKQVEIQDDSYGSAQLPDVIASCSTKSTRNIPVVFEQRKCVIPMTFSQKLYQCQESKSVEEFKQAIDANSLEKIKKVLNKVFNFRVYVG